MDKIITWTPVKRKISDLKPYEHNPRWITGEANNRLKDSINRLGFFHLPAINLDMTIISGHQRIEVLRDMEATEVLVMEPNRLLTDEEIKDANLVANMKYGEWDFDMLANEFDTDALLLSGFTEKDIGMWDEEPTSKEEKEKADVRFTITVHPEDSESLHTRLDTLLEGFPRAKLKKKKGKS